LRFKETFEIAVFPRAQIALFIEEYFEALPELMRRPAATLLADLLFATHPSHCSSGGGPPCAE
jgi:hypothetical protein